MPANKSISRAVNIFFKQFASNVKKGAKNDWKKIYTNGIKSVKKDVETVINKEKPAVEGELADLAIKAVGEAPKQGFSTSKIGENLDKDITIKASSIFDTLRRTTFNEDGSLSNHVQGRLKRYGIADEFKDFDFKSEMAEDEGKHVFGLLRNAIEAKEFNHQINNSNADIGTLYGERATEIISFLDTISDPTRRLNEANKYIYTAKKIAMNGDKLTPDKGVLGVINKQTSKISDKLDAIGEYADAHNLSMVSKRVERIAETLNNQVPSDTKIASSLAGMAKEFRDLGVDGERRAMAYMDAVNKANADIKTEAGVKNIFKEGLIDLPLDKSMDDMVIADVIKNAPGISFGETFQVNKELAESIGLTQREAMTATRWFNLSRTYTKHIQTNVDKGVVSNHSLLMKHTDAPNTKIVDWGNYSSSAMGDLGIGHRPIVPSQEYAEAVGKGEILSNIGRDGAPLNIQLNSQFGRKEMSELSQNIDNQMLMSEALGKYSSNLKFMGKNHILKQLDGIEAEFAIDGSKALERDFSIVKDLREHITNTYKNEGAREASLMGDALDIAIYSSKIASLSSPRMALANTFQSLTNTMLAGPLETIKQMGKKAPLLLKGIYNVNDFDKLMKSTLEGEMSEQQKYVVNKFFNDFHNDYASVMVDYGEQEAPKVAKKIGNWLTKFYQLSDLYTRNVTVSASTSHFAKVEAKHIHLKKSDPAQFINNMAKDLHLNSIGYNERKSIVNSLLEDNSNEVAYKYAKAASNLELYNYGQFGRPELLDRAKGNNLVSSITTFTSWPMHQYQMLKKATKAFKEGDKAPLMKHLALGAIWFAGISTAINATDDEDVEQYFNYMLGRTPLLNLPLSFLSFASRPVAGIMEPTFQAIMLPYIAGLQGANEFLAGGKQKNLYSWMETNANRKFWGMPVIKKIMDVKSFSNGIYDDIIYDDLDNFDDIY